MLRAAAAAAAAALPALALTLAACPAPDDPDPIRPLSVGTWNLENFSDYGPDEWRLDDVGDYLDQLDVDVLAVQELRPVENEPFDVVQALDEVVARTDFEAVHAPWRTWDTSVGVLYRPDRGVSVLDEQVLFADDSYAFPRPPLHVTVEITQDLRTDTFDVVSLHLKAHGDDVDRRRAASERLAAWADEREDQRLLLIGDLNDDPYDPPADSAFDGTLLNVPEWTFLTGHLPPESVTSTGWYHWVDGEQIQGEFIDHAVMHADLLETFSSYDATILGHPESDFDWWRSTYSDHFPVVVTLTP